MRRAPFVLAFLAALAAVPAGLAGSTYSNDAVLGPGVFGAGVWHEYRFAMAPGDTATATVTWDASDGLIDGYFMRPSCSTVNGCADAYVGYYSACPGDGFTLLDASPATFSITAATQGTHRLFLRPASGTAVPYHLDIAFSAAPTVVHLRGTFVGAGEPQCLVA